MEEIDGLPENMVLIKETCGVKVLNHTSNGGRDKGGFYIREPIYGFVKKDFWEDIKIFQSINLDGDNELKEMLKNGYIPSLEEIKEHTDWLKLDALQKRNNCFYNKLIEFQVLVSTNKATGNEYKRVICYQGQKYWERVDLNHQINN